MSIYKCKMCGGALEIGDGDSVAVCEYCGTKQTVPKLDSEKRANLYDRANHFFRNDEFDKAMGIYEQILGEDKTDAEAYWSIVLCRYGVEYVEDPATYKRVPTVNRTQFTSILADEDYKSALEYADGHQKSIYEEQAKIIDKIQKDILAISQQEEPFDVFICYKETDNGGRRTPDSVLANELYHELNEEGFKVFFSRITLEDKIGTAYEPYIFSALNSAKVMVVLGTRAEYFQAAWVKNEWSRYLALIRNGEKKMLIPAYRDMDPYDLPEEFSHLQAQDMSKLGFMQDLVRGIKKIAQVEAEKPVVVKEVITGGDVKVTSLLKRAFMFLEDGEFKSADEYFERILDNDPECAEGYLGKLMAELKVRRQEEIADCAEPFAKSSNYQKILRFGDKKLVDTLKEFNARIIERNELERKKKIYATAVNKIRGTVKSERYEEAAKLFESIGTYEDSEELAKECREKAKLYREQEERKEKDQIYDSGINYMATVSIPAYEMAVDKFKSIPGWKDADEKLEYCDQKLYELRMQRMEEEKRKNRKVYIGVALAIITIPIFIALVSWALKPMFAYNSAMRLYEEGKYEEAYLAFQKVSYKNSEEMARNILNEHPTVAQVGDVITFGKYEQDNDMENGEEDIEWVVYHKVNDTISVISKYVLLYRPYDELQSDVGWHDEDSLMEWLNKEFLDSAFNEEEQSFLVERNDVGDKVFLVYEYMILNQDIPENILACEATEYAKAGEGNTSVYESECRWWAVINQKPCIITDAYKGITHDVDATNNDVGVRPIIDIEAPKSEE